MEWIEDSECEMSRKKVIMSFVFPFLYKIMGPTRGIKIKRKWILTLKYMNMFYQTKTNKDDVCTSERSYIPMGPRKPPIV